MLETRGQRLAAVLTIAAGAGLGTAYLKNTAAPILERDVSARLLWRQIEARGAAATVCLGDVKRDWAYGLNYYAARPLPSCGQSPMPVQVLPAPRGRAVLAPAPQ
jgi:hypothetical protein